MSNMIIVEFVKHKGNTLVLLITVFLYKRVSFYVIKNKKGKS